MVVKREIIGDQVIIGGRTLSLSKAIRAGDFVFLTGQIPMKNGQPMTTGTVEEQTKVTLEEIKQTLKLAGCGLKDIVKSMVWLRWFGLEKGLILQISIQFMVNTSRKIHQQDQQS